MTPFVRGMTIVFRADSPDAFRIGERIPVRVGELPGMVPCEVEAKVHSIEAHAGGGVEVYARMEAR